VDLPRIAVSCTSGIVEQQNTTVIGEWPAREKFIPRNSSIQYTPLVDHQLVLLPLYIKLDFVTKALGKGSYSRNTSK
jgi:hypothetical protein